ncbi:MAG: hypothetical protein RJA22_389 [Verrucomicrobiota bacterium]
MTPPRSAIVTVAMGQSTEKLDYTFTSFADHNPGIPLHAFILGDRLPTRQLPQVTYHLVPPIPDFSDPLREIYFRRMELIDQLDVEYALVVDSFDVLCLQPLPPFEKLVGDAALAAVTEHQGSRYLMGQGYTANFLNCGVVFWNIPASRDIRRQIVERGRRHFRTIADDQFCLNEVVQTLYYDQLRILPCQYNYRCHLLPKRQWNIASVRHLDGVKLYHNATCIEQAKQIAGKNSKASLIALPSDLRPLTKQEQFLRKVQLALRPHLVNWRAELLSRFGNSSH